MVNNVNGINSNQNTSSQVQRIFHNFNAVPRAEDTVEISSDVMKLRGVDGVRMDKVMEVRKSIANGTYLTSEKLDIAFNRVFDELELESRNAK